MSIAACPEPDMGLESAKSLVVRIFDFVASDKSRLARFLHATGLTSETLDSLAESRFSFLSVLDAVLDDRNLLLELQRHEQISQAEIELARARLAFDSIVETTTQSHNDAAEAVIRERVKQLLRALSQLMQERKAGQARRSASGS